MSIPVATALGRRDRMWPAVLASLMVHAGLIAWALARQQGPEIDLEQKPIVAKLVRLGEKRPEQWLPRKEQPPEPPAAEPMPAVATAPAPAPAPPAPSAPVPGAKPAPTPPAPRPPARPGPTTAGSSTSVSSMLSRVKQEVERERWGDPEGDPAGDASEAGEGDRYLALVKRALQENYRVPATISERDRMYLKGTVVLWIEPDGNIARWRIEKSSGNGAFDDALERTVRQTRLPPPPDAQRQLYRSTGLAIVFEIG